MLLTNAVITRANCINMVEMFIGASDKDIVPLLLFIIKC